MVQPVTVPERDRNGKPMLQADWLARGVWKGKKGGVLITVSLMPMHQAIRTHLGRPLRIIMFPPRRKKYKSAVKAL